MITSLVVAVSKNTARAFEAHNRVVMLPSSLFGLRAAIASSPKNIWRRGAIHVLKLSRSIFSPPSAQKYTNLKAATRHSFNPRRQEGRRMKSTTQMSAIVSATVVLTLMGGIEAPKAADVGVTNSSVKIGMIGSLTGAAAAWGWPTINGAKMVYDDVNAAGGIHGRKIEVVVEDTQCSAPLAVAATKKLIHRDNVFMLHGGSCSGEMLPVREEVLASKVPTMVLVATMDQIVQKQPNDYIFRAFLPGSYDGTIIADFLSTVPNIKKVVVVGHSDEHANARYGTLTEGLKKHGIQLLGLETVEVELTDATAQAY